MQIGELMKLMEKLFAFQVLVLGSLKAAMLLTAD